MERLSSTFFMVALILYYVPKNFKMKKKIYLKAHIITGLISIMAMILLLLKE